MRPISIRPLPPRVILGVYCAEPWMLEGVGSPAIFMSRAGLDEWLERYGEGITMQQGIPEEYLSTIVTGDARELVQRIPDESIDLIFADPVYWQIEDYLWLGNVGARVLKNDRAALLWQGQQWLDKTFLALAGSSLKYRWVLGWYASNNMQMVGKVARNMVPLLWYEKGHSNPIRAVREVKDVPIPDGKTAFKWAKRPEVVQYFIERFTNPGDVVFDPFSGGGSTAVICKRLGRQYIAFEIDPDIAEQARQRLAAVQVIDPVFLEEQAAFELDAA